MSMSLPPRPTGEKKLMIYSSSVRGGGVDRWEFYTVASSHDHDAEIMCQIKCLQV